MKNFWALLDECMAARLEHQEQQRRRLEAETQRQGRPARASGQAVAEVEGE